MLNRTRLMNVAAWMAILISPALVRAQALADRVPADTMLYIGWQGVNADVPGFKGSNFEGFLNDSNIPEVLNDFLPKVLDRIAKEDKDAAQAVEIVRTVIGPMWRHPSAIAFEGVEINQQTGPRPKLLLLCQAGKESAALKAKLDDLLKQAGPPPFPVNVIAKGDLVAVVVGYDKPETAIPDAPADSLAANADFSRSLAQVGKGAFITEYFDMQKFLALVDIGTALAGPDIQKNWQKARDMLGLAGIQRAIVTAAFDGKDWSSRAFVAAPAPRSGLVASMLEGKPLSREILQAIPENATIAGATHFDLAGLVAAIRGGIAAIDPDTAKQVDGVIDQINQTVGLDVQKDLLGSLGDEWAYYVDPTVAGNGIVGITIVNRLKDPAKAEASILKVQDVITKFAAEQMKDAPITLAFRQSKIDGITVHYLGLPLVTPAWAARDGNLYKGLYPEIVATAANQVTNKSKAIAVNPAFAALMKRLGDHPMSSFGFIDIPRRAPENYSSWVVVSHMANAGDLFGVPAPLKILPPLDKLMKHLTAAGRISWTDADGLHVSGLSPFPGAELFASDQSSMSIYEVSMMTSVMLPAMNNVRGEALKAKSSSNLKNIAAAAITYANTHNGKYPRDMAELVEASGMTIQVLVNPRTDTTAPNGLNPEQTKEWVAEHSDYVWNGGGKDSTMGENDPLAWEDPAKVTQGVNILFGDYHVAWFTMPAAMELIEKAKKPKGGL